MARAKNNKKQNPDSNNRRQEMDSVMTDGEAKNVQAPAADAELETQLTDMLSDLREDTAELDLSEYTNPKDGEASAEAPAEPAENAAELEFVEDTELPVEGALAAEIPAEDLPDAVLPEEELEAPAEAGPAEEKVRKPMGPGMALVRMAATLTVICAVVALLLAVVNAMTADVIAANAEKKQADAILRIFTDGTEVEPSRDGVWLVYRDGEVLGYCASVQPVGYAGAIDMMVGVDTQGQIVGVQIVDMKETSGVGSKTRSDAFLGQYAGQSGPFGVGDNIDGIVGATVSSKAVTEGVNMALALQVAFDGSVPETETEIETEPADVEPAETKPVETEPETEKEAEKEAETEPETEKETEPETKKEAEKEPETKKEPETIPAQNIPPVVETEKETTPPAPETKPETTPPAPETKPETTPPAPETEPETTPPAPETEPETAPPASETEPETEAPAPETEPETEAPEPETEPETEAPEPETEPETEAPEPETEGETRVPALEVEPEEETEEETNEETEAQNTGASRLPVR